MTRYYDLILGLIPLALVGITGTLHVTGVAWTAAVPVAGLVAVSLVGHALFVRAPVDAPQPSTQSATASNAPSFNSAD